jgi:hypothetical protein
MEAYFPENERNPKNAESLWRLIDSICQDAGDFYGGPFYLKKDAPFADYLLYQKYKGSKYSSRLRITDNLCAKKAGNPSSVFKCVGPESVGSGSIAGMRLLHYISDHLNKNFLIWPFQYEDSYRSVILEIYPALFYKMAGENTKSWQNHKTINNALEYFSSEPLPPYLKFESKDQIDAIISAAAIRHLSNNPDTWRPAELSKCARVFEGWIFGS